MIDRNSHPRLRISESMTYWAGFVGEHYLRAPVFGRMRASVAGGLLQHGFPDQGKSPVPAIDLRTTTPERIRRDFIKPNIPIVLKGVAAHWPAVEKWTPEFFKSNYGRESVCVRVKSGAVGADSVYFRDMPLADLIDNVVGGGEYYANNLEDLFNHNPELRSDLLLRELETISCPRPPKFKDGRKRRWRVPRWGEILSTQIFISNGKGRTGYHCALAGNFFVQLRGRKHWVFVNPRHTPFMYPIIRKDFMYSGSAVDHRKSREELIEEGYGLYNVVPKYEVVLEPGDVLYSPQWWWHTVDNLDTSIGVALRFRTGPFRGNPVYSFMTYSSPGLWKHAFGVIRTGWGGDETGARKFFEPEGAKVDLRFPVPTGTAVKSKAARR